MVVKVLSKIFVIVNETRSIFVQLEACHRDLLHQIGVVRQRSDFLIRLAWLEHFQDFECLHLIGAKLDFFIFLIFCILHLLFQTFIF